MKKHIISVGTKSVLFGAHCFIIHPFFVAIAWIKLYGFTFDPRIWLAFFVHDLGYLGKPNMDGIEGETHPELGASIMHLFDIPKLSFSDDGYLPMYLIERGNYWKEFSLYHSRYYAKKNGAKYSKLCVADKLAFCIEPYWLYIFKATLTGEIHEYMSVHHHIVGQTKKEWHTYVVDYMIKWVEEHKDLKPDNWTTAQNEPAPEIEPDLKPEDLGDELCHYWCEDAKEYPSFMNTCEGSRCGKAYDNYLDREK